MGILIWSPIFCQVDLIFVFFDPIGQALCKRTLNIVEALSEKHSERIRFYLSKADEVSTVFPEIFTASLNFCPKRPRFFRFVFEFFFSLSFRKNWSKKSLNHEPI